MGLPSFAPQPYSFAAFNHPQPSQLGQLYFNTPMPPAMSAPHQTLGQKIGGYVANKLRPVVGQRMAQKIGALPDYSPIGAVTTGFDLGSDLGLGNYGSALGNAAATALNMVPDVGPVAKGMFAHSIIAPLFHGSPHAFEKFSLDKIGTGEGAQAYGHGLYFAENPTIAKDYQEQLSNGTLRGSDGALIDPYNFAGNQKLAAQFLIDTKGDAVAAKRKAAELYAGPQPAAISREIDALVNGGAAPSGPGHLYKVSLNAEPQNFLNWDAPLSGQPTPVMNAITGLGIDSVKHTVISDGSRAYGSISMLQGGDDAASEALRQRGVLGIRYLDQGSRGAGQGTSNYVVFDPSIIDILNRR